MNRYGTGIALVAVGGIVMTGALAADDAKELQAQLREAKATLSNYERGRYESPAVRAAKEALAKAQADDKAQVEAALKAKPEAGEVQKKIEQVETQRKEVEGKIREAYKAIEANAELVALKKKTDEAQAAWKAKYEELVKANAAIADMSKARDAAGTAINEANAKLVQIRLADNKEVADLKAKVAALEAKIAEMKPKKEEKKPEPKKDAAKPAAQ